MDTAGAKEAKAVNMSLGSLQKVIDALAKKSKFVPFRDHALTRLMQESLTDVKSTTIMIVTVSPSKGQEAETRRTIELATSFQSIA